MKVFSSTELRVDSSAVFNEVQANKEVGIVNRSRPPMVLILRDHLEHLKDRAARSEG